MKETVETIQAWKYSDAEQEVIRDFLQRMHGQFRQGLLSAKSLMRKQRTKYTVGQVAYYRNALAAVNDSLRRVSQWQSHTRMHGKPLTDE